MEGYLLHKMPVWQRVLAVLAGLLLIIPGLVTDAIGIGVIGLIALWQLATRKKVETLPSSRLTCAVCTAEDLDTSPAQKQICSCAGLVLFLWTSMRAGCR